MREVGQPLPALQDFAPDHADATDELLAGLSSRRKSIPTRLLYDARGVELFEAICETDEYYLRRTELHILRENVREMAALLGPDCLIIEYGSGMGLKTRLLLDHLSSPVGYVPIEISREVLRQSTQSLRERYPGLRVLPVCADYTSHYELPPTPREPARRAVFFPGSTIGNFERDEGLDFIRHIAETVGPRGRLLVGVDLHKDTETLERAYDDASGTTAQFELNALAHLNREFGAEFRLELFEYCSFYNKKLQRIEMYLVSLEPQRVRVAGSVIEFARQERILMEYAQKYTLESFRCFAAEAGFSVERVWVDDRSLFSIQYLARD
ncbi:MAG: L-histidine N(alpha)-methyltransferase [Myxococcota bacterium]